MTLEEIVKNTLSEKRFYHSKCVMDKCAELAQIYDVNVEMAKKVGIAHDIAKEMPDKEKLEYVQKNNIPINEIENKYTGLLHAKIGADIAQKQFGFNKQMAYAIEAHTTGKPDMDMLGKILYIADWIGLDRDFYNRADIEKLAKNNINEAIIYTLQQIIKEKLRNREQIHVDTILTINSLLN